MLKLSYKIWPAICCIIFILAVPGCVPQQQKGLPILGQRVISRDDTIYHTIPNFAFIDQDSTVITSKTFDNKIYVADFFFTSCKTICPVMKTQMFRVYEATSDLDEVGLLSHTIDPAQDTVGLLHDFADRMGVSSKKWHFVTGIKDSIYKIAKVGYFATAMEDKSDPDGFIHSGAFLLIDKKRRIRGKYDGTKEEEVSQLIKDIKTLLVEEHEKI